MEKKTLIGIALFVSLGFNLFALGFMVGKPPEAPQDKPRGPHFEMMAENAKQLPEAERARVMDIIKKHKSDIRDGFKDMQEARKDVDALLKSDAYNRAEAEALFAKLSESAQRSYRAAQVMMMDIADALPPEQRALMMPKPREHQWSGGPNRQRPPHPPQE
jgi:Spy/CpxP family protein refolding chaperone